MKLGETITITCSTNPNDRMDVLPGRFEPTETIARELFNLLGVWLHK